MAEKIILEKGKRVELCFERFGKIKMFVIDDIKENDGILYARLDEITYQKIDSGQYTLSEIPKCEEKRD